VKLIGRQLMLNGAAHTVVGVVPADFRFPDPDAVLWVPAHFTPDELAQRFNYFMYVVARLAPGVSVAQAQSEMNGIASQLAPERGITSNPIGVTVAELHEHLTRDVRKPTLLLLAGAALILLITCANVGGLLMAHGVRRRVELTVRNVLGAERSRLVRQLLTESLVIATAGAAFGLGLATLTFGYLRRLVPPNLPGQLEPVLDARVLLFTIVVTAAVVLVVGTVPTWLAVRSGLDATLRSNSRRVTGHGWSRSALVVVELALTVILLTGAGLLLRSYANVLSADAGFNPGNLLLAETTLSPERYALPEKRQAFYNGVLERVRAIPGVSSAGYVNYAPLVFKGGRALVSIEGRPLPPPAEMSRYIISDRVVSAGYFATLQVPVSRGRDFDSRDVVRSLPVAIINEKLARLHWPGEDPIGRRVGFGPPPNQRWLTIVGIVRDIRQMGLDVPPEPEVYLPAPQVAAAGAFLWPQNLVVRTQGAPLDVAAAVRSAVWSVDHDQPVASIRTMADVFDAELLARNTQLTLVSVFAVLALTIAVIGLYGLLAHGVSQRLRDIGVRMALGAPRSSVVADVARQSMAVVTVAVAAGLAAAFAVTRLLGAWLYDVSPADPVTFGATALVLFVAALTACIVPALRAASVDPAVVLRAE
jgi:predicted permease